LLVLELGYALLACSLMILAVGLLAVHAAVFDEKAGAILEFDGTALSSLHQGFTRLARKFGVARHDRDPEPDCEQEDDEPTPRGIRRLADGGPPPPTAGRRRPALAGPRVRPDVSLGPLGPVPVGGLHRVDDDAPRSQPRRRLAPPLVSVAVRRELGPVRRLPAQVRRHYKPASPLPTLRRAVLRPVQRHPEPHTAVGPRPAGGAEAGVGAAGDVLAGGGGRRRLHGDVRPLAKRLRGGRRHAAVRAGTREPDAPRPPPPADLP
ncbi:hypothetical protein THAOC_04899, partial [Thalassiosira oceanica]